MPITYKNHSVVAGAAESTMKGQYIPVVSISWGIDGTRGTHSMILRERFPTFAEASEFALAQAKAWVDQHAAELD
jgi:hypothetical protein